MIPLGGGIMMHDFIMKMWKRLLDDWMGCGATLYIVTPRIDEERLFQLFLLMIRNKGTEFHVTLVTPTKTDGIKFLKVLNITRRMMKKARTPRTQKRLLSDVKLHWAMNKLSIHHADFSTNFVAGLLDDDAEVLSTTAQFNKKHFHTNQRDTVSYNKMSADDLRRNFLFPLGLSPVNY